MYTPRMGPFISWIDCRCIFKEGFWQILDLDSTILDSNCISLQESFCSMQF